VRLIAEGLLQKVNHYHTLYPWAQLFLWMGMLCSVLTCSVLLGLFYNANYPGVPWMWRLYSGILLSSGVASFTFLFWMKYRMLKEPLHQVQSRWANLGRSSDSRYLPRDRLAADNRVRVGSAASTGSRDRLASDDTDILSRNASPPPSPRRAVSASFSRASSESSVAAGAREAWSRWKARSEPLFAGLRPAAETAARRRSLQSDLTRQFAEASDDFESAVEDAEDSRVAKPRPALRVAAPAAERVPPPRFRAVTGGGR